MTQNQAWNDSETSGAETRRRKEHELAELRKRVDQLEDELADLPAPSGVFPGYYGSYYATTGFMLGGLAAITSLLFNVVGSTFVSQGAGAEQHPLRLIQVYLTFPFGERALHMTGPLVLALGCCMYIATGMMLGIVFNLFLTKYTSGKSFGERFIFGTLFSLVVWVLNFYVLLSWLQPALFGGRWIVDMIPAWVAAATHLVFGWTMVLLYPWGLYVPYSLETEKE